MSALARWHDELARRQRTVRQWDALFFEAQREAADEEFEREYGQPQRLYLKLLKERAKPKPRKRNKRAQWEVVLGWVNDDAGV